MTTKFQMRNVVKTVAILAVSTMMFASCEPAEDDPTPDPGTEQDANFVAFTFDGIDGAAEIDRDERTVSAQAKETVDLSDIVAEFTLSTGATATVDGTPQVSGTTANDFNDPVIYEVTSGDGETTLDWTVTIIKEMAVGKKYITYNKPVTAYYIEYNGGMVDANKNGDAGNYGNVIEAYSTGIKAEILWNDNDYVWDVDYHIPGLMYYGPYGTTTWTLHEEPDDDTFSTGYYEYPLGEFAAFVAEYKGTDTNHGHGLRLFDIATSDDMEMPDRLDVTEYYVRSEKVMDTLCDVYQAHDLTYEVDLTFWVDPDTGLTLKYKCEGRSEEEYEVTKLILDTPDWDELRLRPQDGDTIIEP